MSNAIKFTPKGGSINIALQKLQEAGQQYIQLRVSDTGTGIEAAKLPHIFDRFYQADASSTRMQEGSGIGLALVKELVELQNGKITVESAVNEGSAFTLNLPVTKAANAKTLAIKTAETEALLPLSNEAPAEAVPVSNMQEKAPGEKLELLIVEDHAEMREYIRSCLDASLYQISEAANGAEGIEKAQEIVPDLIISDVMMPKKDGFELTHAIRNHTATSHIPLILLTARASLESRLKGLERGADAYLTKPFSPEELAMLIKKLIELRRLLQQRYQGEEPPGENEAFQKEDRFVHALKTYITDHIAGPGLDVETISRHFAISRTQLYRKLKALINEPLNDYIRSIRMEKAMQLLKNEKLSISEVAYAIGFSSPGYFSTSFKKVYGKSPSEWFH